MRRNPEILIRLMVGLVFLSEGIQKFLFPDEVGVGRFEKIGIPSPEILAPFVGVVEITCGAAILFGWKMRLVSVPLLVNMTVAILTTKLPILLDHGFWKMAHESRTDFSMVMGLLFLFFNSIHSRHWRIQ